MLKKHRRMATIEVVNKGLQKFFRSRTGSSNFIDLVMKAVNKTIDKPRIGSVYTEVQP